MTRFTFAGLFAIGSLAVLAGCGGSGGSTSASGSPSGTGAPATGAATGGSTGSATGSSGAGSGSGSGSGAGNGTTTGRAPCAPGAVWNGNICQVSICSPKLTGAGCPLIDGGQGECYGTSCIDVSSDPAHCGLPEVACATGLVCDAGSCVGTLGCSSDGGCPAGDVCQPDGRACLPADCNSDAGQRVCANGTCCGSVCSGLTDTANCGACGVTCAAGGFCRADPTTLGYVCSECSGVPDNTPCGGGGFCCNGTCEAIDGGDALNCGACGFACPGGSTCPSGFCVGDCATTCPAGRVQVSSSQGCDGCVSSSCTAGHDGTICGNGAACCGTTCVKDILSDPQNCGGCGVQCGNTQVCRAGVCVTPQSCLFSASGTQCILEGGGQGVCCNGSCTDLSSNSSNCSACGQGCTADAGCVQGACTATCSAPSDCPTGSTCIDGLCQASCASRLDGDTCTANSKSGPFSGICCGGACTTSGDGKNCGGCGLTCPPGLSCSGNGCVLPSSAPFVCGGPGSIACPRGQGCSSTGASAGDACVPQDCTSRPNGDICAYGPSEAGQCCAAHCVASSSDASNCGGCGISCPSGTCAGGVCQPLANPTCTPGCGPAFSCINGACVDSVCTGSICITLSGNSGACCSNGACVDVTSDSANCGGCGLACPQGDTCLSGACQGATCSLANEGSYCGLPDPSEACCGNACLDVTSDPSNCGLCGRACLPGQACTNGNCG